MWKISRILLIAVSINILMNGCRSKSPENEFAPFDFDFFNEHVPEYPGARLLVKTDIPENQQSFFDEEQAQLQLLHDVNNDSIPDYIVCGVADSIIQRGERGAYFITMFEKTESGFERLHIQQLRIAPVNIKPSKDRPGVLMTFTFSSDYAAEIYYENGGYHLQRWY
jgi:hypothetical protein